MIFEKVYDTENLRAAWDKVRANNAAPGIDRVTCKDFEKSLLHNLQVLQRQIRDESYKPLPVVVFKDKRVKKEGRTIGISAVRDKVVQQAVVQTLTPHCEPIFLPCSYAYRPKKSALSAVKNANRLITSGNLWSLQIDVKEFFDRMDHMILLDLVRRIAGEKPIIQLVSRLTKARIFKEMGFFDNVSGSHQGSGLSPLLSNIYLHPLDKIMWSRYKDRYLRYSDDIAYLPWKRKSWSRPGGLRRNASKS
ncbi:MAG: hypothetical protein C4530_03035 [Desulfobacteraceae bacterium]|nr:MAG: hypothetical protein C4530_03035 [Desulfobacteraceae bacterium]